mmetsp:Transcript_11283/g.15484  ORF Transcript_11283/g.15484 Transcript_11283/m.15484 type:complete len:479 (+) Transcript_11283:36-1472(+)
MEVDKDNNDSSVIDSLSDFLLPSHIRVRSVSTTDEEDNQSVVTLSSWSGETNSLGGVDESPRTIRKCPTEGSGLDGMVSSLPLSTAERMTPNGVSYVICHVGVKSQVSCTTILLVHGTGMNAGTWFPTIAAIETELIRRAQRDDGKATSLDNLCGIESKTTRKTSSLKSSTISKVMDNKKIFHGAVKVIALDWCGHGKTSTVNKLEKYDESWCEQAMSDIREVLGCEAILRDGKPTEPIVGVGHSIGCTILVDLETKSPETFKGLVFFEPIIKPCRLLDFDEPNFMLGAESLAQQVEQRNFQHLRPPLSSVGRQLRGSGAFGGIFEKWHDHALDAFAQRAFITYNNEIRSRCPTRFEACTFRTAPYLLYRIDHTQITCPIAIAAGAHSNVFAHAAPSEIRRLPDASLQIMAAVAQECQKPASRHVLRGVPRAAWRFPHLAVVSRATHFIPMEQPTWSAKFICDIFVWALTPPSSVASS